MFAAACAIAAVAPGVANAACANPAGAEADITYNTTYHMLQFCNGVDWIAMAASATNVSPTGCRGPADCPAVASQCADTSYFAGCNPYNGRLMFIHPNDQGTNDQWDNQVSPHSDEPSDDRYDGSANQAAMQAAHANLSGFAVFNRCKALRTANALGRNDWYLPSQAEIYTIWINRDALNAAMADDLDPNWYWSSTERPTDKNRAYAIEFGDVQSGDGSISPQVKDWSIPNAHVRCMRSQGP